MNYTRNILIASLFLFILTSISRCGRLNTSLYSTSLCGEINPSKPNPTLPVEREYTGNELLDSGCVFQYQRLITVTPATSQDEKQVRIELDLLNFDYNNIVSDASTLRFMDAELNIYDYWIERWNPLGTSVVWVQVPSAGSTEFFMYYGINSFSPGSDPATTFDYSSPKSIYHELHSAGGNANISSYTENNNVTIQNSGPVTQNLNLNETQAFAGVDPDIISVTGAISGRVLSSNGYATIAPLSLAAQVMGYAGSRGGDSWEFYNPTTSTANVTIEDYNSTGVLQGVATSLSIPPGSYRFQSDDFNHYGLINSDQPIIAMYRAGTTDANLLAAASTEYTGVHSGTLRVGLTVDGTNGTIYFSNGTSQAFSGNRGERIEYTGGGSQGSGNSYKIIADQPIVVATQADSDGSETVIGLPLNELNRDYIIPTNAQYIAISAPYSTSVQILDSSGGLLSSATGSVVGDIPLKFFFGTTANTVNFAPGTRIVSDQPIYVYYEYENQDETLAIGPKQGRLVDFPEPSITVGPEEGVL